MCLHICGFQTNAPQEITSFRRKQRIFIDVLMFQRERFQKSLQHVIQTVIRCVLTRNSGQCKVFSIVYRAVLKTRRHARLFGTFSLNI